MGDSVHLRHAQLLNLRDQLQAKVEVLNDELDKKNGGNQQQQQPPTRRAEQPLSTRDLDDDGKADLYENNFEKYCSAGRDPHPRSSAEEGFKLNERRWTGEEDRVKEWQEVIEQEDRRKTLGKQNTVAVENPSLEKTKSKATTNRTHSLGSSWGSKQSLQEKKNKKKERLYET